MRRSRTRAERLRSGTEIRRVLRSGTTVSTKGMRLSHLPNDRDYNRVVVVPARGFRTAVARNRCRRHGKEAYRALQPQLRVGFDLAIVCYQGEYSFADRLNQLSGLLNKARLLREAPLPSARSSKEM